MKPVQYFTDEYLQRSRNASPESILEFLESFRLLSVPQSRSKLISMKVPEPLLNSFRHRCELSGLRYQTQIKQLMEDWLRGADADD